MTTWDDEASAMNAGTVATFGRAVTYTPLATGIPAAIQGIYETPREEETALGIFAVLFVNAADLPSAPAKGDHVTVSTETYAVFQIEADQARGVRLGLHRGDGQ